MSRSTRANHAPYKYAETKQWGFRHNCKWTSKGHKQ